MEIHLSPTALHFERNIVNDREWILEHILIAFHISEFCKFTFAHSFQVIVFGGLSKKAHKPPLISISERLEGVRVHISSGFEAGDPYYFDNEQTAIISLLYHK